MRAMEQLHISTPTASDTNYCGSVLLNISHEVEEIFSKERLISQSSLSLLLIITKYKFWIKRSFQDQFTAGQEEAPVSAVRVKTNHFQELNINCVQI
jgi:hypothetical protein